MFVFNQAHCYNGQTLLNKDKCGEAVRALKESDRSKWNLIKILYLLVSGWENHFCYITSRIKLPYVQKVQNLKPPLYIFNFQQSLENGLPLIWSKTS